MKLLTWLVALLLGSLTLSGTVNSYPFTGASAVAAIAVGLVLGAVVGASVVTAAEQLVPSLRRRRVHA